MNDRLLEHIDKAVQKTPFYKEALSVYMDLLSFLNENELKAKFVIKKDELIRDIKVKEGFPLFSRDNLPFDIKETSLLFFNIIEQLLSKKRKDKDSLQKILVKLQDDSQWIQGAINAFLSSDKEKLADMSDKVSLSPMVLSFLTHMALKPSLEALKEAAGDMIQREEWDYGYCPLCGSSPDMAFFDGNGKRSLHCELCGLEWNYQRLKCPFCENSDAKKLGYFVSEDNEGLRVDFCKKCNFYIKTVDMRVNNLSIPLELENLLTLHLDMLAHEQGFKSPGLIEESPLKETMIQGDPPLDILQ